MEIKLTNVLFFFRKKLLTIVMRAFIFLLCTAVFSFTPSNVLSQNAKIKIDEDKTLTIHEVFKLISNQTDYKFIYSEDLFENAPNVQLKKGTIKTNQLLELSLSYDDFNFVFTNDGTIVLNKKPEATVQQQLSGNVTDSNGLGLPGVTIIEKGTTNGTSTNIEGKYNINVSGKNAVLVFSFVGFTTQDVIVNEQAEINVILEESIFELAILPRFQTLLLSGPRQLLGPVRIQKGLDVQYGFKGQCCKR